MNAQVNLVDYVNDLLEDARGVRIPLDTEELEGALLENAIAQFQQRQEYQEKLAREMSACQSLLYEQNSELEDLADCPNAGNRIRELVEETTDTQDRIDEIEMILGE